jgi:glycosyltransferase involved in cell wall biosynthesis
MEQVKYDRNRKVILNISAVDYSGAGKFSVAFHQFLMEFDYKSYLTVKESKLRGENIIEYPRVSLDMALERGRRWVDKKVFKDNSFAYNYYFYGKYERRSVVSAKRILSLIPEKPDIIFIHWSTDFVNAKIALRLGKITGAKVFYLLIDNAPLSGGCHYPWDCEGFVSLCRNCPAISAPEHKWLAESNLRFKKRYIGSDIGLIAFSESDFVRAKKSALFRSNVIRKILAPVDESVFKPGDPMRLKAKYGISEETRVVLFGAASLKERRKGMELLIKAISMHDLGNVVFLVAGEMQDIESNASIVLLGYLDEEQLIETYQLASVYISPSIEDSGPMMVNQAMMCGTPVVAFDIGVAQDLVITGETGYKAVLGDVADLANGLKQILEMDEQAYSDMCAVCRQRALSKYSRHKFMQEIDSLVHNN